MALTKEQEKELKEHSKHHTEKHMDSMREQMEKGRTFNQAHLFALRMVGD